MRMLKAGRFSLDQLITKVYSLAEINDAIDDMRSGRAAGRCLVRLNS
jgi:Zn-dependent alcohol dehydrogenase